VAGLLLASLSFTGCGPSISTVNGKPDSYYGKVLRIQGRIGEILVRSETGKPNVFQLVSKGGHRIIVVAPGPVDYGVGDRVHLSGEFTPERTIAGQTFYDVVSASEIRRAGRLGGIPFL